MDNLLQERTAIFVSLKNIVLSLHADYFIW